MRRLAVAILLAVLVDLRSWFAAQNTHTDRVSLLVI